MSTVDEVLQKLQEAGLECLKVYEPEIQEQDVTRTYVMLADGLSLKVTEKPLGTTLDVMSVSKNQLRALLWSHPCEDRSAFEVSNALNRMKTVYDNEFDSVEEAMRVLRRMLS